MSKKKNKKKIDTTISDILAATRIPTEEQLWKYIYELHDEEILRKSIGFSCDEDAITAYEENE